MIGTDTHPAPSPGAEPKVAARSWYMLGIFTLIFTLNQVDRRIVTIVLEPIRAEFGLSDSQLGLLTGIAFAVSYVLCGIPMGMLVDRVSRRNMLALVLFIWSGFTALSGAVSSFVQLVLLRTAMGGAESGASPALLSLISDLFPPRRRTTASSILLLGTPFGALICFGIGGLVAQTYGWRAVFIVAGVPGMLVALLVLLTFKEPVRGAADPNHVSDPSIRPASLGQAVRLVWGNRAMRYTVLGGAVAAAGNLGITGWLASFAIRSHGLDLTQTGLALGLSLGIANIVGLLVAGPLTDRFARGNSSRMLQAAMLSVVGGLVFATIALLSPWLWLSLFAIFAYGLFTLLYLPQTYAVLLDIAPVNYRGIVITLDVVVTVLIGYSAGPYVVGLLSDAIGGAESLRWALLSVTGLYWVAAFLFFKAMRALPPVGSPDRAPS